eukprot:365910-Chlamydomonas_euryale.AAC.14
MPQPLCCASHVWLSVLRPHTAAAVGNAVSAFPDCCFCLFGSGVYWHSPAARLYARAGSRHWPVGRLRRLKLSTGDRGAAVQWQQGVGQPSTTWWIWRLVTLA